ncbi:MAG TPA: acyl-CoA dehydrogenase, partial [Alcanivorax sp.]|nr:acyl-CoA dehydrogenase [Alcanivorax sp.]
MADLSYFNETHGMVRDTVRKFVEREILPQVNDWEEAGTFPRELYKKAADAGILGIGAPERWGGSGEDVFMKVAACEEITRCTSGGVGASLGSLDIGLPPVWKWGSEALQERVVPAVLAGDKIAALAITEPGGGSDVANLRTKATRDGDHYV